MSKYNICIPARLHSTRLEKKLLLSDSGKPLLVHTLENLQSLRNEAELWLISDSEELLEAGKAHADHIHFSDREFASGSERIADVIDKLSSPWVLNVQADEPEIDSNALSQFMKKVTQTKNLEMATLGTYFSDKGVWENPNAVKVLTNEKNMALYFSRAAIPHGGQYDMPKLFHHLGVYAYHRDLLKRWSQLPKGPFETSEKLEQLRALENGVSIMVYPLNEAHKGIDTREDYLAFLQRI